MAKRRSKKKAVTTPTVPLPADALPPPNTGWKFRLPGHLSHTLSIPKAALAVATAYSTTTNPRNLEHYWYACWDGICNDLTADIPNALVCPQFPLWFKPEESDNEDQDDHDINLDEDIDAPPQHTHETESAIPDTSSSASERITQSQEPPNLPSPVIEFPDLPDELDEIASARTITVPKAKSRVPDFAVIIQEVMVRSVPRAFAYGGHFKTHRTKIGAIFEIKACTSRSSYNDPERDYIVTTALDSAKADVLGQAARLFLNYPDQTSVICVAAAGPDWTRADVKRVHVAHMIRQLERADPTFVPDGDGDGGLRPSPPPRWREPVQLGQPRSLFLFAGIHTALRNMGRQYTGCISVRSDVPI